MRLPMSMRDGPIQVWVPHIRLDWNVPGWREVIDRAQGAWNGETRMWFLPSLRGKPRSWSFKRGGFRFRQMALPSPAFNVVDVAHVVAKRLGGSYRAWVFPKPYAGPEAHHLPEDLLQQWLNVKPIAFLAEPPDVYVYEPRFGADDGNGPVEYVRGKLAYDPITQVTTVEPDSEPGHVISAAQASQVGRTPLIVSPDWESVRARMDEGSPGRAPEPTAGEVPLPTEGSVPWPIWPPPFKHLFPIGIGGDLSLLLDLHEMKGVHELAAKGKHREALSKARAKVSSLTAEAASPRELAEFLPHLMASEEGAVYEIARRWGLKGKGNTEITLEHAVQLEEFRRIMDEPVQVTRVFDWAGMLWLQLYEHIKSYLHAGHCPFCGRALVGGRRGRGCRKEENRECFLKRNREAQRKLSHKKRQRKRSR